MSDDKPKKKTPPKKVAAKRAVKVVKKEETVTASIQEGKPAFTHLQTNIEGEIKQVEVAEEKVVVVERVTEERTEEEIPLVEAHEHSFDKEYNAPAGTRKDVFNQAAKKTKYLLYFIFAAILLGVWYLANKIAHNKARQKPEGGVTIGSGIAIDTAGTLASDTTHQLTNAEIRAIVAQLAQQQFDSMKKSNHKEIEDKPVTKKAIHEINTTDNADTMRKYMRIILADGEEE